MAVALAPAALFVPVSGVTGLQAAHLVASFLHLRKSNLWSGGFSTYEGAGVGDDVGSGVVGDDVGIGDNVGTGDVVGDAVRAIGAWRRLRPPFLPPPAPSEEEEEEDDDDDDKEGSSSSSLVSRLCAQFAIA